MRFFLLSLMFSALILGARSQSSTPVPGKEETPKVTISLVGQMLKTDPYFKQEYALLQFRLENQSDRDVLLYGRTSDTESGFGPFGYALRYDNQTQEWRKPTYDHSPMKWAKDTGRVPDCVVLSPKKEVIIETSMKYEGPRELVKTVMYIAFYGGKVIELTSPEFILK